MDIVRFDQREDYVYSETWKLLSINDDILSFLKILQIVENKINFSLFFIFFQ